MTITNGYATLVQLKDELSLKTTDTAVDARLERAINAASRQIDGDTGRRFWQDGSVVAREFYADSPTFAEVDDISTTTGLIVKVDSSGTGTYATTLTISTHVLLMPRNAAHRVPVWPYTGIVLTPEAAAYFPVGGVRPSVQVTAKYGWPAVPDDITRACLIQATQLFKAGDAVFGGLSFGDGAYMRVRSAMNPMAEALLDPYRKATVS
jgi:hypothetical protein